MENLHINMTDQTPEVEFKTTGELSIKGVSIPENTHAFYTEPLNWLKELDTQLPAQVILNLDFEYLNTASNRSIVEVIRVISKYKQKRTEVTINWIYPADDEDAKELGEDIEFCVDLKFKYQPKEN